MSAWDAPAEQHRRRRVFCRESTQHGSVRARAGGRGLLARRPSLEAPFFTMPGRCTDASSNSTTGLTAAAIDAAAFGSTRCLLAAPSLSGGVVGRVGAEQRGGGATDGLSLHSAAHRRRGRHASRAKTEEGRAVRCQPSQRQEEPADCRTWDTPVPVPAPVP